MNRLTRRRLSIAVGLIVTIALPVNSSHAVDDLTAAIADQLASAETTRIVCFGDSITGAYYHTGGQRAWCDMLGFALQKAIPQANIEMINAGISGHTTVNALARIETDVLDKRPDLVVVMFGMNDVTRVSIDDFRSNLQTIAGRCRDSGAAVVLCTPNSVYQNDDRPNAKLAQFAEAIRAMADQRGLPLVDVWQDWQQVRDRDQQTWMLMMSDTIHPNMNGHKRIAKLIAKTITGKDADLDDVSPPTAAFNHTFDLAQAGSPIKFIATSPYDRLIPELIREHFSAAKFVITPWPTSGQTVGQTADWAKRVRGLQPDLVMPAVPAYAVAADTATLIRDYEWVLNWSFQFSGRPWDVVPVSPFVAGDPSDEHREHARLARQILIGKDVRFIDRPAGDQRTRRQIVADWIAEQKRVWLADRAILPDRNEHVYVSTQSWPHRPGPRLVKVSVHYPGGSLANVTAETGLMLTLHNWGGRDCAGTADPNALADRLNVIALCVDYLQSGRPADGKESPLYDFGYLQAIDALRALAYVRQGLTTAGKTYDDGRIFCTGGSGGGNVTLMANKLAPRTFACVIDMCGMKKLTDDIAFDEPGGSSLDARWSRDPDSTSYLSKDAQELRFVGHPSHLQTMQRLGATGKIVVVHGADDATCLFADAEELVANLRSAGLPVDAHFIRKTDLDGEIFTSSGHALGNRTEIVFRVAGQYLSADGSQSLRRSGLTDFDRKDDVRYQTTAGDYVVSYRSGVPVGRFEPQSSTGD